MKNKRWILWLAVAILIVVIALVARHKVHFDWHTFVQQLRLADWKRFAIAIALIWLAFVVRATRWSVFLRPTKRVSPFSILGTQVIGFTGVALLGRAADLVRPYLVARRVRVTVSSQMAVYVVERMFDAGAMALLFSTALFFAPDKATLPHPELLRHIAQVGLLGTLAGAAIAIAIRLSGHFIAVWTGRIVGHLSAPLGRSLCEKILAFREGLAVLASAREVVVAALLSLLMWCMIATAYFQTTHAFVASPQLSHMTVARCMVLMAVSMAASAVQLPVIGWFTQIAALAAAMQQLFGAAWEPALGCGAMLLIVTFLSIIPVGLIWSRFEHVSLKKIAAESEHATETAAVEPQLVPEA